MEYFWQYNNQADQNNQAGRNYEKLKVVISEKTSEKFTKNLKNLQKFRKKSGNFRRHHRKNPIETFMKG